MKNQRGITLIGAIFVLIIVSLLGQYLINLSSVQRQTSLLSLQSARAYQAANAGLEWGVERILVGLESCVASTTLSPNINNLTTTVNCSQLGSYSEDTEIINVYKISAHSQYNSYGSANYVSRKLEVVIHAQ